METGGPSADVATSGEFDRVAEALGHRARRRILVRLLDHNPLDYAEILEETDPSEREAVTVPMIHTHLPKLDGMGYVSWDRDAGTVVKGDRWSEIESTVRVLRDNEDRLPGDVF